MGHVLSILAGAAFTVGTAFAAGSLLLNRLRVSLYREEAALMKFVCGSALLSLGVFLLCVAHAAKRGVFFAGGAVLVLWAWRQARTAPERKSLPALPRSWLIPFLLVFSGFFFVYFFNALAPETSPDGSGYHLGNVIRILQRGGFVWDYHSLYSYLSQGMEMLFLVAFSVGRHSAASLVHFAYQLALPLLIVCYGSRFGFPKVGLFAAILVYVCPVAGKAGVSAYNDLAVATIVFATFYLLQVWDETKESNLLILIGLVAGFGYGVKYTAAFALPFVLVFIWSRGGSWREFFCVGAAAGVMIMPWVLRNWIWIGNPIAPFFNSWFPNPYFHPGMERIYLDDLRSYTGVAHWWQTPWQIAVEGRGTTGTIGPIFLLAPLALVALRQPIARRLLAAAMVFAIPAYFNSGSRFLIPSLPFLALALGLALASVPTVLAVLAMAEALACWPWVLTRYCDEFNWRLRSLPIRAALRREPEPDYLKEHLADYSLKSAVESFVPARSKIFAGGSRAEAYLNRTFVVAYESALGNLAQDVVAVAVDSREQPTERRRLRFLPVTTRKVRVVQTSSASAFWSIAEMRMYRKGGELPRGSGWRLRAWPNGWEVQQAFDNSYATRWSSWQPMTPGMFVEVDFGKPEVLDEVDLEEARRPASNVQVEVWTDSGRWAPLSDAAETTAFDIPSGLRRAAARELRAHGIGYLFVSDGDFFADDMRKYSTYWSLTELATAPGLRLYLIN